MLKQTRPGPETEVETAYLRTAPATHGSTTCAEFLGLHRVGGHYSIRLIDFWLRENIWLRVRLPAITNQSWPVWRTFFVRRHKTTETLGILEYPLTDPTSWHKTINRIGIYYNFSTQRLPPLDKGRPTASASWNIVCLRRGSHLLI